ncbi:hypothetical protein [Saccharopolyspora soli]|nr:hypothetical protein [Saccharopolyspora soli]
MGVGKLVRCGAYRVVAFEFSWTTNELDGPRLRFDHVLCPERQQ